MDRKSEISHPDMRWNWINLVVDGISWSVTFSFVGLDSVMPLLVSQLTDSAPVIGLVGTIYAAGWLLPQLMMARLIHAKPRKKPYMVAGLGGRIMFWGTALGLWAGLARKPALMLTLFFVLLGLLAVTDSLTTVALFDIISRALPTGQRGRMFGVSQVISGAMGIGVGVIVAHVLAHPRLPFPANYATLFALAGVAIIPSNVTLALIREPPPTEAERHPVTRARDGWLKAVIGDPDFRRLIACQVLVTMIQLATPFFVIHASEVLNLPQRTVGSFVIALAVAGVVASAALGLISERWGPHYVIRIGSGIAVLGPILALAAHFFQGLGRIYALVFAAVGVATSIRLLGFRNYLMGIAQKGMGPAYIGMANTILGTLTLAPMMGGWLLEATSYPVLFGITAAFVGLGFAWSLTLGPVPPQ
jgi:MFS family permease